MSELSRAETLERIGITPDYWRALNEHFIRLYLGLEVPRGVRIEVVHSEHLDSVQVTVSRHVDDTIISIRDGENLRLFRTIRAFAQQPPRDGVDSSTAQGEG